MKLVVSGEFGLTKGISDASIILPNHTAFKLSVKMTTGAAPFSPYVHLKWVFWFGLQFTGMANSPASLALPFNQHTTLV